MTEFLDYTKAEIEIMYNEKPVLFEDEGVLGYTGLLIDGNMPYENYIKLSKVQSFFHMYQQELVKVVENFQEMTYDYTEKRNKMLMKQLDTIVEDMRIIENIQGEEVMYPIKFQVSGGNTDIEYKCFADELIGRLKDLFGTDIEYLVKDSLDYIKDEITDRGFDSEYCEFQIALNISSRGCIYIQIDEPYPPDPEPGYERIALEIRDKLASGTGDKLDILKAIGYKTGEFSLDTCIVIESGSDDRDDQYQPDLV